MKPKVYVSRLIPQHAIDYLKEHCEVFLNENDIKLSENELIYNIKDKDGLICLLTDPINKKIIKSNSNLKIISNFAVGFDNIDIQSATESGIMVTNTPGVLDDTTAELAFALMISASRRIVEGDRFVRDKKWTTGWEINLFQGFDIHHKTLGIFGMGNIGKTLAKKVSGFDMKILYHNRKKLDPQTEKKYNVTYVDQETLLKESDFISLHVPRTPETHHLIGEKELSLMKKTAILINTARGTIIDEKALYKALKEKQIWGAGLDVFEEEPKIVEGLTDLENVVVLPHIGSASVETRGKMAMMVVENMVAGLSGLMPPNILNKEVLK